MLETTEKVVVIGASTGGTEALRALLEVLPPDAPGIVIVQHMPEEFTRAFAKRLDGLCQISVKEAENDDTVTARAGPDRSGQPPLAAETQRRPLLRRRSRTGRWSVAIGPRSTCCSVRPRGTPARTRSAVILTGMGDDGARGMLEMKEAGAATIAQDEATCVVFGMPNEAIKLGAVDMVLPLPSIAGAVLARAR